jgi:DNA-binding transcriptional LysR family regulator
MMTCQMNLLAAMQIYQRVAELESFTRAAESLGAPKASISTAVQQLENLLGTRLLHRTTRKVQMTQDGQVFYERSKDLLCDMDELQTMFQQKPQALTGRLRVDMPIGIAKNLILPLLPTFLRQHPLLCIELSSTDRRVDLVREGFDCVVRIGALQDSSLIARPLGMVRQINCASPAYLAEYGIPQTLADLSQHRLIHYTQTLGSKPGGFECQRPGQAPMQVAMQGALTVNNSESYRDACLAGLGLIQVPEIGVTTLLTSGQLQQVLPDHCAAPMAVNVLYANRRHLPRRTQVFISWLTELMQHYCDPTTA